MRNLRIIELVGAVLLLALLSDPVLAETRNARLDGFQEVPANSTTGRGVFIARISEDEESIQFVLSYSDLEFAASGAHIHLGQPDVDGGIVIHLCGTGGKPACPMFSGTVTDTLDASDVVALPAQGIAAGELGEVIRAIRGRVTYVNVHTGSEGPPVIGFPNGEIRGQIR